jgi:CBS domain-containing protein
VSARHFAADDFDADRLDEGTSGTDPIALVVARRSRAGRARVAEAMSAPVKARPEASLDEIASLLERDGLHGVAVVDGAGRLLGVVTRTNLLERLRRTAGIEEELPAGGALPAATTARDLLTPAPVTVTETATIAEAADLLATRNVHQLPVVLRTGELVGMITALDLARWVAAKP